MTVVITRACSLFHTTECAILAAIIVGVFLAVAFPRIDCQMN